MSYANAVIFNLATNQTVTGAVGPAFSDIAPVNRTFQAIATAQGLAEATVVIQVSNDGINYITLGTITLSAAQTATDGFASAAPWKHTRANVTAITAGTSVNVIMGV